MPFVSSVSPSDTGDPALKFESLIQSSVTSINRSKDFVIDPKTLKDELFAWPVNGPHTVGAHITGDGVSSYFAGKQRPSRDIAETADGAPNEDVPAESAQLDKGKVNLVVLGSNLGFESIAPSRLIADFNLTEIAKEKVTGLGAAIPYYIRFVNTWGRFVGYQNPVHLGERGNLSQLPGQQVDFFRKSVELLFGVFDWATGDVGLAQIRAKGDTDRPIKVTESQRSQVTYGLVFGLPLFVILLSLFRFYLRRMARNRLGGGA